MATNSRLLLGALYTLLSSRAIAQTTTALPPAQTYANGQFYSPDTAKTQVFTIGSTMTISWSTVFKSVDIYLVSGQTTVMGSTSESSFRWIVDDHGNNSLPFSILAVDGQGSPTDQVGRGFWTGQFWIADNLKDIMPTQTTTMSTGPTQNVNVADMISTTSEGADDQDITSTKRVVRTQTTIPTSTADGTATSHTASSSTTLLPLPAVTIAEAKVPQNTTTTQPSFSTISTLPTTSTVYVAQTSPTTSLISGAEATESASFLERHNFSTPSSGAKIAAIGLGAGFGAVVLVVVAIVAMWLLHRRRKGDREVGTRDEGVKLERQGD